MTAPTAAPTAEPTVTLDPEMGGIHVEPSGMDFGPTPDVDAATDFTDAPKKPRGRPPKNGPRPAGQKRWGLGTNKSETRTSVPNLTNADREKIVALYQMAGTAIEPFKPQIGQILKDISTEAADAWAELARENATVRRWLRALMEGGAWSKLAVAHSPLIMLSMQPLMMKVMERRMRSTGMHDADGPIAG